MASLISPKLLPTVLLPSAAVLVAVAAIRVQYLPFALVVPILLFVLQRRTIEIHTDAQTGAMASVKVQEKALKPDVFQKFKLIEKTILSHNVAIYRFSLHSPTQILGLPIGQHMSVTALVQPLKSDSQPEDEAKQITRSYTPISSDENVGYFDLLIKAYPTGNISRHVASLDVGSTLDVRGPKGAMVYTPGLVSRFGMIAGGTGITPMLQIIRAIVRNRPRNGGEDRTTVDLIFANVNVDDILLKADLDTIVAEDDGFNVFYVLNNPPPNWQGGTGFVTSDMIKDHLPQPAADMKLLICGPPPMVSAMKKTTESLGYQKARPISKLEDQVFCF